MNRQKFINTFTEPSSIYKKMKDRFHILDKTEVFNLYLRIDDFEQQIEHQNDENIQNLEQQFRQLFLTKEYTQKQL